MQRLSNSFLGENYRAIQAFYDGTQIKKRIWRGHNYTEWPQVDALIIISSHDRKIKAWLVQLSPESHSNQHTNQHLLKRSRKIEIERKKARVIL